MLSLAPARTIFINFYWLLLPPFFICRQGLQASIAPRIKFERSDTMGVQNLSMIWNNITIEVNYNDNWSNVIQETYGYCLAHLEIRSQNKQPLPITGTGYKSHFTPTSEIEEFGGAVEYVNHWLDQEVNSKEWKKYVRQSKQLTLF